MAEPTQVEPATAAGSMSNGRAKHIVQYSTDDATERSETHAMDSDDPPFWHFDLSPFETPSHAGRWDNLAIPQGHTFGEQYFNSTLEANFYGWPDHSGWSSFMNTDHNAHLANANSNEPSADELNDLVANITKNLPREDEPNNVAQGSPTKRQLEEDLAIATAPEAKRFKADEETGHDYENGNMAQLSHTNHDIDDDPEMTANLEDLVRNSSLFDEIAALTKTHNTMIEDMPQPQQSNMDEEIDHGLDGAGLELGSITDWVKTALGGDSMGLDEHSGDQYGLPAADPDHGLDIEDIAAPDPNAHLAHLNFLTEPIDYMRNMCLHTLANTAITVLSLVKTDTVQLLTLYGTDQRSCFITMRAVFESLVPLYSDDGAFVAHDLSLGDSASSQLLCLANITQLAIWSVEGCDPSRYSVLNRVTSLLCHEMPELATILHKLCIEIRTQSTIGYALVKEEDKPMTEVINERLLADLPSGDEDAELRESLQHRADEMTALGNSISTKYSIDPALTRYAQAIQSHLASMQDLANRFGVYVSAAPEEVPPEPESPDQTLNNLFGESDLDSLVNDVLAQVRETEPSNEVKVESVESNNTAVNGTHGQTNGLLSDYDQLSALVAESTADYVRTTLSTMTPTPYQPTVPPSTTESMNAHLNSLQHSNPQPAYYSFAQTSPDQQAQQVDSNGDLPPNQSVPTSTLYDRARQAALSRTTSSHTRREGMTSTRRPWSQEEEKALMAGLDMVKGPHWSQILTLFGTNGTINDVLKDRSQVQLKDKARNLKLFFLKTNSEMPYYLHAVTGELKTRAPGQAARKEAEERARMNSEEDQARVQGIMTLAGGLQHPPQNRTSGSPSAAVGAAIVTPAQAAAHAQATGGMQTNMSSHRPIGQSATQQVLQSMPQPPPRPQTQLPPHVPRPQTQHQPAAPQHIQQAPTTPQPTTLHLPTATPTMTPTATPPQPSPFTQPALPYSHYTSPSHPPATQPSTTGTGARYPSPKIETNASPLVHDDNALDAEALRGLQAAIAEPSIKTEAVHAP